MKQTKLTHWHPLRFKVQHLPSDKSTHTARYQSFTQSDTHIRTYTVLMIQGTTCNASFNEPYQSLTHIHKSHSFTFIFSRIFKYLKFNKVRQR